MRSVEKRKLERFKLEIPATVRIIAADGEEEKLDLMTRNVCSGGACFRTDHPFPIGTELEIDLVLPLDKFKTLPSNCEKVRVSLSGRVLRIDSDEIGVRFDDAFDIQPANKAG